MSTQDVQSSINALLQIDPYKESIRKDLWPANKRGTLEKFGRWIIHIISFKFIPLNSELDQITKKTIETATTFFEQKKSLSKNEQITFLAAFNNLKIIVMNNQGAMQNEVGIMIKKISKIAAATETFEDDQQQSNLLELLGVYENESPYRPNDASRRAKLASKILSLIPEVHHFCSKYDKSLFNIILADSQAFSEIFPKLKPEFIEAATCRVLDRHWAFMNFSDTTVVLKRFSENLLSLPNDHPNLLAFIRAFPLEKDLPKSFEYREMKVMCWDLAQFLVSDAFEKLTIHVRESERDYLFQNLPSYASRSLESGWDQEYQTLLALPDKYPAYRKFILQGFARTRDFDVLKLFKGSDAETIASVWMQDLERCYREFIEFSDRFNHPAGQIVVKKLINQETGARRDALFGKDYPPECIRKFVTQEIKLLVDAKSWREAKDYFLKLHPKVQKYFVESRYDGISCITVIELADGKKLNDGPLKCVALACQDGGRKWMIQQLKSRSDEIQFLKAISKLPEEFLNDVWTPFGFYLDETVADPDKMHEFLSKCDPDFIECFDSEGKVKAEKAGRVNWVFGKAKTEDLVELCRQNKMKELSLAPLLNDSDTSDFTIFVDDKEIKTHKCVLSGALHYFNSILRADPTQSNCEIEGYSYEEVLTVIKGIYESNTHFNGDSSENVMDLFTFLNGGRQRLDG